MQRHSARLMKWILDFLSNWGLILCPIPCGPMRKKIVGVMGKDRCLEFYSHPNFVCTAHLIWVGWILALAGAYNEIAASRSWWSLPMAPLTWAWMVTLLVTITVLGLRFDRVACALLISAIVICGLLVILAEISAQIPLLNWISQNLAVLPVAVPWGVPAVVSLVLGLIFAGVVTWQRVNDRWLLPAIGNYIEHVNFQDKDRSISKGAKNFVAVYHCLVRRYLFFGYGDIEVRSSVGSRLIDRIEGVFFASEHAEAMKRRLSTMDVTVAQQEEDIIEEEEENVFDA